MAGKWQPPYTQQQSLVMATATQSESVYSLRKRKQAACFLTGKANTPYRLSTSLEQSFTSQSSLEEQLKPPQKKWLSDCKHNCGVSLIELSDTFQTVGEQPARILQKRRASYKQKGIVQRYRSIAGE